MSHRLGPSWRDVDDRPVAVADVPGADAEAFYRPIGELQGADYRRNAFAGGTDEEVAALWEAAGLRAGRRVLDVGCGDGRHLRALVPRGVHGTGVDVSPALVAAARAASDDRSRVGVDDRSRVGVDDRSRVGVDDGSRVDDDAGGSDDRVEWLVGDARELPDVLGERLGTYDVAWSLCQGGLGTSPVTDPAVLAHLAGAVRAGGTVVCTFFSALFAARHLAPGDAFDPVHLVHHQLAEVRGPDHARTTFPLWTASYTVRDTVRLCADVGLEPIEVRGVEPGAYGRRRPGEVGLDDPELLVVARRP